MSFDKHVSYGARCDIWVDRTGAEVPHSDAAWAAWEAADRPADGPIREALGTPCGAPSGEVYADTAGAARRKLEASGWAFKTRRYGGGVASWRAVCPDHKGLL